MVKFANNLDKKSAEMYLSFIMFRECNYTEGGASIMRSYEITRTCVRTVTPYEY